MKKIISLTVFMLGFSLFLCTGKTSAHELFIQVEEVSDSEELRVDVIWGHIRDFTDVIDIDDLDLHVQYPNGDTEQMNLEEIGVQARAFMPVTEEGTYIFRAVREPSTYTPDSGVTQLSDQSAKHIYHTGNATPSGGDSIELDLEIMPEADTNTFSMGIFTGTILLNG